MIEKTKKYNVNEIVNFLSLLEKDKFFLNRKYKGEEYTEKTWKSKLKKDKILK